MSIPANLRLRWDDEYISGGGLNCSTAFLGEVSIASIVERSDGSGWAYNVRGVSTKWHTKGHGLVSSKAGARRAVQRAWKTWLTDAGLIA
jgi:hypothetical protein